MQSQIISQNVSPKNDFEISPILVWNLQYSLSKWLEGIDLKALYTVCFDKDTGLPFYLMSVNQQLITGESRRKQG